MPAERFYVDAPLFETLILEGAELHHLAHVMRVRVGEEIELVNGKGALATAKVLAITKHKAELEILSSSQEDSHPQGLILAIPLMRPSKLELIIEKCTELGADAFWLYPAGHSEKDDLSANQTERLFHVAISAMKQCGRLWLPEIKILKKLEDVFHAEGPYFFGDPRAKGKMPACKRGIFITGPERGFSEKELTLLNTKAKGVLLHRNVLRAETAPIAAAAIFDPLKP